MPPSDDTGSARLFPASLMRKLEMLAVVSRRVFAGKTRGERRSTRRGGSVEFSDYRQYAPGDDFRAIDWNAYARLEHLFLKLFVEEEDLAVHVVLDCSKSMDFGGGPVAGERQTKLDLGKRLAAAIVYMALANYDRASVAAFGASDRLIETTPLVRGKGRIFRVFDFLEKLAPREGAVSIDAALKLLVERHRPKPGVVVVVTDLLDPAGYEEGLKRLRYGPWEPLLLHVLAPDELEPRVGGDHKLVDSESPARAVEVSLDGRAIAAYKARLKGFLAHAEGFCRKHGIGYLRTACDVELDGLVLRTLREAKFVA